MDIEGGLIVGLSTGRNGENPAKAERPDNVTYVNLMGETAKMGVEELVEKVLVPLLISLLTKLLTDLLTWIDGLNGNEA